MKHIKAFLFLVCLFVALPAAAQVDLDLYGSNLPFYLENDNEVFIIVGELEIIKAAGIKRASVTDPNIADITEATDSEIMIIGKEQGETPLFIWDDAGKHMVTVYVYGKKLNLVQERLAQLLKSAGIDQNITLEPNEKEGKVILSGNIPEYQEDQFKKILEPFSKMVIDLTKARETEDLVQIDMQITELSTTLTKELGIDWITGTQDDLDGTTRLTTSTTLRPEFTETLETNQSGNFVDMFKIHNFTRTSALEASINALIEEGKGRILSKPKLVVVSGEEATFLVGGEIPIRTSTVSSTGTAENVEFKEYGIGMTITPTVKKDEKVDVIMRVEISDIDRANAVGNDVAFTTRTAETRLYLDSGQTIILAGLIKHNEGETVRKVPYLGDVPILGALFRSRKTPVANQDQEIVISLTPSVLTPKEELPAPVAARPLPVVYKEMPQPEPQAMAPAQPAPVPAPAKNLNYPGVPPEMVQYVYRLQQKITDAVTYPPEAEDFGWEGTVKLGLLILRDGSLILASIRESSGYDVFDQITLDAAKEVATPYEEFPANTDLQQLDITIPIVYSLKK